MVLILGFLHFSSLLKKAVVICMGIGRNPKHESNMEIAQKAKERTAI
jgi:hypothetical protein